MSYLPKNKNIIPTNYRDGRTKKKLTWIYNSSAWHKVRVEAIRRKPICECGNLTKDVHHLADPRKHPELAFDLDNLDAKCHACHSRITMAAIRSMKSRA